MALILAKQILEMFLLAGIGFLLYRSGKISQEGSKALGNILIYASLPAVIINGFLIERTPEHVWGILWSTVGAVVLAVLAGVLIWRSTQDCCSTSWITSPGISFPIRKGDAGSWFSRADLTLAASRFA